MKRRAYLDIESTGLNFCDCGLTGDGNRQALIVLEKGLTAATITGCLLRGDGAISDNSGADVQIGLNTMH